MVAIYCLQGVSRNGKNQMRPRQLAKLARGAEDEEHAIVTQAQCWNLDLSCPKIEAAKKKELVAARAALARER